jgi:DNA polymerase
MIQDDYGDHYVAWHQPDHCVVRLTAPFFQRRFSVMRWTIMTPDDTASWDGQTLSYGPGVPASAAPPDDAWEEMWQTFYTSIFNPARIKIDMMKREMPTRYWHTMPETRLIPQLLKDAPARVEAMIAHQEGLQKSAADYMPATHDYAALQEAATRCQGCPLYCDATQTVFGTGNFDARLMIVGEQPGEQEDRSGQPFIGPAGQLLDQVLNLHGIARDDLYITNAVKHFKHTIDASGPKPRLIHHAPTVREITACKPWLEKEIALVRPTVILCLGLTAARSLLGHGFTLKSQRGQFFDVTLNDRPYRVIVSYHPAAILRMPDAQQKHILYTHLRDDLHAAWQAAL